MRLRSINGLLNTVLASGLSGNAALKRFTFIEFDFGWWFSTRDVYFCHYITVFLKIQEAFSEQGSFGRDASPLRNLFIKVNLFRKQH